MHKCRSLLFLFFLFPYNIQGQTFPEENSDLHYRLIGFKFPSIQYADNYTIEIAAGNYNTEDAFKKNIIKTLPVKKNKIVAEVPRFGAAYTWRYNYSVKGKTDNSPLYHFNSLSSPLIDTDSTRLRIVQPALKYKDNYVFLDGNWTLYDMNGKPIWYLPYSGANADLKLTSHNTLTVFQNQPTEVDYNGKVLWKAPEKANVSGDVTEYYHHEFSRLDNGHYMVLGNEYNLNYLRAGNNNLIIDTNITEHNKTPVGTIMEYDEKGNLVWYWKSSRYFMEDSNFYILNKINNNFLGDGNHPKYSLSVPDGHENAFYFDEKNKAVYISFKNISRIVKLKYPEGTVLNTYGPIKKPGNSIFESDVFCDQHSCRISKDGYLYLFNNNLCSSSLPTISVWQEPVSNNGPLKKIWEYQCTAEEGNPGQFLSGGNVYEMPDKSMFVCMGSNYSKVFIVSHDKEVLWSAMPEKWNNAKRKWENIHQYRASIISREDLENLIWNSEKTEPEEMQKALKSASSK